MIKGLKLYSKGGPKFPPTLCGKWQSACHTNGARMLPSVHTFKVIQLCSSIHAFISCQASVPRLHTLAAVTLVAGWPKPTTYTTSNTHIQLFQSCKHNQLGQMLQTSMQVSIDSASAGQTILYSVQRNILSGWRAVPLFQSHYPKT